MAGAKGAAKVYPITENFALTDPEKARVVLAHNAGVVKETVTLDPEATPADLLAANTTLLNKATAASIPQGTKLIGYDYDAAFPTLLRNLLKPGFAWFVLAAIFGAVVSSLASMLNSASTIATMDIVAKIGRKIHGGELSQKALIRSGRTCVVIFVLIACLIAPGLGESQVRRHFHLHPGVPGIHQPGHSERLSLRLPGAAHTALHGLGGHHAQRRALRRAQVVHRAGHAIPQPHGHLLRRGHGHAGHRHPVKPLAKPVVMPTTDLIALESSKSAKIWGIVVVVCTLALYAIFW
jgi:solute:Na+ symporter, SSS family